jgi:hypothetical protein
MIVYFFLKIMWILCVGFRGLLTINTTSDAKRLLLAKLSAYKISYWSPFFSHRSHHKKRITHGFLLCCYAKTRKEIQMHLPLILFQHDDKIKIQVLRFSLEKQPCTQDGRPSLRSTLYSNSIYGYFL